MAMRYIMLKDQLNGEYLTVCDNVEVYADMNDISMSVQSEKMMDLIDLLLTAQQEGKPPEDIVGKDIERFCENYFSDYGFTDRVMEVFRSITGIAWFVFVMELLWSFVSMGEENYNFFSNTTDISGYLAAVIAVWGVVTVINIIIKLVPVFRKSITTRVYGALVIVFTGIVICLTLCALDNKEISILTWPVLFVAGIYLLVYHIIQAFLRYKRTGSVKKVKSEYDISMSEMMAESQMAAVDEKLPGMLEERFQKENEKLKRKGKEPLTMDGFFQKLDREGTVGGRYTIVALLLVTVLTIVLVLQESTLWNTIVFGVVLSAFETGLCVVFVKMDRIGKRERRVVYNACREKNMELKEYVEFLRDNKKDNEER